MVHVKITQNAGKVQVLVDGVDMAPHIVPEGLAVSIRGADVDPTVTLTLRARTLELDLPAAEVAAGLLEDAGAMTVIETLTAPRSVLSQWPPRGVDVSHYQGD